jgi:hypothetical protein
MALDVSGNWVAGDDLRVIEALGVPFGEYTLTCIQDCCNQLEGISAGAVVNVRSLLVEYEAGESAYKTQNLSDVEGKTLIKADVLEWEVSKGEASGPQREMMRTRGELMKYFSFCSCLGGLLGDGHGGVTALIRS